jgi:hypothetical protein
MLLLERRVAHRARSAGDLTDVACGLHLHRTLLLVTPVDGRRAAQSRLRRPVRHGTATGAIMSQALPSPASRWSTVATVVARETTMLLGVALVLAAASRIVFPLGFTPVPITAQTFLVLVVGVVVGARRSSA